MAQTTDKPMVGQKSTFHPAVTWSRLKLKWPVLIWVGAVVVAGIMFSSSTRFRTLTGVVEVNREEVASVEAARIRSIPVQVGQVVTQGQVLVVMDTRLLDAEIEVEKIQIRRQFASLIQNHEESLRDMGIELAQSKAELTVIAGEAARLEGLLERRLVDAQAVASVKAREEALKTVVALYPDAIKTTQMKLDETRREQDELLASLGEGARAEDRDSGLLSLRREAYTLRASRDGSVSRIFKEPGEVVSPAEVVLTVVTPKPARILGFLPEANVNDVQIGMKAQIKLRGGVGESYEATLVAISPEVLALPGRVSNIPGRTTRGLRVVFLPGEEFNFMPGVEVLIQIPEGQKVDR